MGKIKENFDTWLKNRFFQSERPIQVMMAGSVSLVLLLAVTVMVGVLVFYRKLTPKIWETGAFWTLAVLFVSSPVAFVVWRFRDENQSKDINLKEFQKISEWVTGAHFPDAEKIKVIGKQKHDKSATFPIQWQNDELGIEFNMPAKSKQALHSFSKRDGAVGLQIAAVYNLLPFYRGDYGQAFEKPSVHLLLSAWKVLQHDILQELENADDETQKALIEQLHQRADSPLGQAITRVLLACDYADKPLLHRHPEILPGICLSGMDFNLAGLEPKLCEKLFCGKTFIGAQWQGVRMSLMVVDDDDGNTKSWDLTGTKLRQANLLGARFFMVNFSDAHFHDANLSLALFNGTTLSNTWFTGANLWGTRILNSKPESLNLTKQLLLNNKLIGCVINNGSITDEQKLKDKGLIVLYRSNSNTCYSLSFKHRQMKFLQIIHSSNSLPFPIDLKKTQENNPDWEISIE